ncbi:MAG: hypothetical protein IT371_09995 [Deltaproteobacteria bacterium]|nr:hypothetical protein [Deltaproteobacteria bacterium]
MRPTIHDVARKLEALNAARASLALRIDALEARVGGGALATLREYEAELDKLLGEGVKLEAATARLRREPRFEKFLRAEAAQSYAR